MSAFDPLQTLGSVVISGSMNLFRAYKSHLARRATGLSRVGWYIASAREGAPWLFVAVAWPFAASFVSERNRLIAMLLVFVPAAIGWLLTQTYMAAVHLRDLRGRAANRRD